LGRGLRCGVAGFECCGVCGLECEMCGVNWGIEKESKRKKVKNEKRQQKKGNQI
jgi:hypothetical protein